MHIARVVRKETVRKHTLSNMGDVSKVTVVVTGASGLLGRAVMAKLASSGQWGKLVGTAFSRC